MSMLRLNFLVEKKKIKTNFIGKYKGTNWRSTCLEVNNPGENKI
jgi:hypothetical protein